MCSPELTRALRSITPRHTLTRPHWPQICRDDVTTAEGAESLLKKAAAVGPIGGVFNLAMVRARQS